MREKPIGNESMQKLETLAKNWKKLAFASIAAASLFSIGYLSRNNTQNQLASGASDVIYTYKGRDGFELELDAGDLTYYFEHTGQCSDKERFPYAAGNRVFISMPGSHISIFDRNCDGLVDSITSENGSCSVSALSFSNQEMCNSRTYEEANGIYNIAYSLLHVKEYAHKYYNSSFNQMELPEDQTERLLNGYRKATP